LQIFLEAILKPFGSSVPFLMTSVTSQKRRLLNADFSRGTDKNQLQPGQESMCSSGVTLFFAKKSFTKIDWCAGALS
jgi:hypothetical protein